MYAAKFNKEMPEDHFSMVDIGTGTGKPLQSFMKTSKANRVKAIDIN
jgi:methylase of polypeptide subunit release factors